MSKKTILPGIIAASMLFLAGCSSTSFTGTTTKEYEPVTTVSPEVGMPISLLDPVTIGALNKGTRVVVAIDDHNAKVRTYNEIITKGGYDPLEMTEVRVRIFTEREEIMKKI